MCVLEKAERKRQAIVDGTPPPKDTDEFGPLDYLAYQMYLGTEHPGGGGVRWWCLREDMRKKYREMAEQVVFAWGVEEFKQKQETDRMSPKSSLIVKP